MRGIRGVTGRRARWLVVFTFLLLASSAVPVLAESEMGVGPARVAKAPEVAEVATQGAGAAPVQSDSTDTKPESPGGIGESPAPGPIDAVFSPPADQIPGLVPTDEEFRAAFEAIEREEAQRKEELRSADSKRERAESRFAFASSSDVQTKELLDTLFTDEFARLNADPARELSDASIVKDYGEHGALVESEGETRLMEGNFPRRAEDEDGELRKVDLDLRDTGDGFEPENPLTELAIPAISGGEIKVGDDGIAIVPLAGDANRPAQLYGDQNVLYTDVDTDTDRIASPTSGGVELFDLLRSADSPEVLRYGLRLPEGAVLRPNDRGGAEVIDGKEVLLTVSVPRAVDAQGSEVPVSLSVQKEAIELNVPHREKDLAHPILVDPVYEEFSWYWGWDEYALWAWDDTATNYGLFNEGRTCLSPELCSPDPKKLGLFITSEPGSYWAHDFMHWTYAAPNMQSYVESVSLNPFWRVNHGGGSCSKNNQPQPHDYAALMGEGEGWNELVVNKANDVGSASLPGWGYSVSFGLGTGNNPVAMPCWRSIMLGGAIIHLNDWANPNLANPTGVPSGWIKSSEWHSIGVSANDSGLGVKSIQVENQTGVKIPLPNHYCTGQVDNRCPTSLSGSIPLNAGYFAEGKGTASIVAHDALEKSSVKRSFDVRVDSTGPKIALDGQLAVITEEDEGAEQGDEKVETLSSSVYNLKIKTEDGSNSSEEKMRSGVKNIKVYLDEKQTPEPVDWEPNPSPCQSCSMEVTYPLELADVEPAKKHTLKVVAIDQIENENDRTISFKYFPATGMKDEYVMHYFPLDDGEGNEAEEENPERPELAVNVMNGNLVYREQDIDVEGAAVDLEVERYYNSLLAETENSEMGDGWTLGDAPALEAEGEGGGGSSEGTMVEGDGALAGSIPLPSQTGGEKFNPRLRATFTKLPGGAYEVKDETGEASTSAVIGEEGKLDELQTEGLATVDYTYESGDLAEIAVDDPASTDLTPEEAAEREELEDVTPTYKHAFGSVGTGNGQLKVATDIAIDPTDGTIWVADSDNNRVQHFGEAGTYIGQFATCFDPSALEVDSAGQIIVACSSGGMIRRYSDAGAMLKQIAVFGSANGQVRFPTDIALDADENLWVADYENGRVQKFDPEGKFVKAFPVSSAWGIDVSPSGKVWVAQTWGVSVYEPDGTHLFSRGGQGTDPGKFERSMDVEVDDNGYAWVTDAVNNRVQVFDEEGAYVTQFGETGQGEGQLDTQWWLRIAVGPDGAVWVLDSGNARVQRWRAPGRIILPPDTDLQDDPQVDVEVTGGLVETIEGEEAGELSYEHDGDLLTSVEGPDGETEYEYDGQGRMTRVELENGVWAEIKFENDTARVVSVEVDSDGPGPESAKTTYFTYSEEPTRTYVDAPDVPVVVYDIGIDGSIFQWEYVASPPEFENISGSLWVQKETLVNKGDHNLVVLAESPHGIASIEVIANGDQLLEEETCVEPPNTPQVVECQEEELQWVTSTSGLTPGILHLEMVITDQHGRVASQRFWVDVPHTPPPPPGVPQPPNYAEIKQFREEFGLDIDIKDEPSSVRNNRIWRLLYDWGTGDPVARASREKWGVPLRPVDVAEMEYREWYIAVNGPKIMQWGEDNYANTYAGYWVDHRNGGILRVGLTANQQSVVSGLKQSGLLVATERLGEFGSTPAHPISELVSLQAAIGVHDASQGALAGLITRTGVNPASNRVAVGATDVGNVQAGLQGHYGSQVPISVYADSWSDPADSRWTDKGPLKAGQIIGKFIGYNAEGKKEHISCSAGPLAKEYDGKRSNGQDKYAYFVLTAGHCFEKGDEVLRFEAEYSKETTRIGEQRSRLWQFKEGYSEFEEDGAAVTLDQPIPRSSKIVGGPGVKGVAPVEIGRLVCASLGERDEVPPCEHIRKVDVQPFYRKEDVGKEGVGPFWQVVVPIKSERGDSGSPIYYPNGDVVGVLSSGPPTMFTALLPPPLPKKGPMPYFQTHPSQAPGLLRNSFMGDLSLVADG